MQVYDQAQYHSAVCVSLENIDWQLTKVNKELCKCFLPWLMFPIKMQHIYLFHLSIWLRIQLTPPLVKIKLTPLFLKESS